MTDNEITQRLRTHPFLEGLPEHYFDLIAGCSEIVTFEEGDILLRQNQPADRFYLLVKGLVSIRANLPAQRASTIETVAEPGAVGWSWLSPPYKSHFDVVAVRKTRAILVHTACLIGEFEADYRLGYEMYRRFMEVVVDRLQNARIQMMDIYSAPGRD